MTIWLIFLGGISGAMIQSLLLSGEGPEKNNLWNLFNMFSWISLLPSLLTFLMCLFTEIWWLVLIFISVIALEIYLLDKVKLKQHDIDSFCFLGCIIITVVWTILLYRAHLGETDWFDFILLM